jgi:hypothetical protein
MAISMAVAVFALLLVAPESARAADYTEEQLQTFKQNLAAGTEAFNNKNFDTALAKYKTARSAIDEPRLTYRIALTLEKLNRCRDARASYAAFLEKTDSDSKLSSQRSSAKQSLQTLQQRCPPTGTLSIRCEPSHASVTVAGETSTCPATASLPEGKYTIEASADDYQSASATVTVTADQTTTTKIVMTPMPGETDGPNRAAWRTYGPWIAIGTGAILVGTGVATDASAVSRADDLEQARRNGNAARIDSLRQEAQAARTRTWALYGSGLAVAAGGAIWYIVDRPAPETSDDTSRVNLRPRVSPASLGLQLTW